MLGPIGFGNARLQVDNSDVHLRYSNIDFVYRSSGKTIEDYTATSEANHAGTLLSDLVKDISSEHLNKANAILAAKVGFVSSLEIYFSAHLAKKTHVNVTQSKVPTAK